MQFPSKPQSLDRTRADFLVNEFRQFVAQKGLVVVWEQTVECPCNVQSSTSYGLDLKNVTDINTEASGNNIDCPACGGLGFIRHSSQEIQAIVTNSSGEEITGTYGTFKKEEVKLSLLPEHLPSYGDRFTLKNSVLVWREITKVDTVNPTVTTSRPIVTRTLSLATGDVDVNVLYIHKTNADGTAPIDGEIPSTDYVINANGDIEFTNPLTQPDLGTRIVVAYYANPTFSVVSYPHTIRDTVLRIQQQEVPTPMLVQAMARLEVD